MGKSIQVMDYDRNILERRCDQGGQHGSMPGIIQIALLGKMSKIIYGHSPLLGNLFIF